MFKLSKLQEAVNISIQNKLARVNKQTIPVGVKQSIYERNKLDYLYLDANMIIFLHSLLPLHQYNSEEFYLFTKGINNILEVRYQIEEFFDNNGEYPINTSEMFETALKLKTNTLNNLHNFIYSVPKTNAMYNYIEMVIERYNILVTRNLDIINKYYKDNINKRGIQTSTKFVNFGNTKHFEDLDNHTMLPGKTPDKLVQFYI
jgi:hypothetical protein